MVLSSIIKDKYLRMVGGLSLFILLLTLIILYVSLGSANGPLIIHVDPYRGIDFQGTITDVFGILISGAVIILINLFLADFLYSRERFLSYIFSFSNLGLSALILIIISVIISLN